MKSTKLHKKLIVVIVCMAMIFVAKAQTASSLADLKAKFAAAVATGVPQTITIASAIVINQDCPLVSTGDSITLVFTTAVTPITVTAGTLTIGNKVKITSALANSLQALVGGTVIVNAGCRISSSASSPITAAGGNVIINGGRIATSNLPAASAGLSATVTGGTLTINGGYLVSTATGTARGVAVDYLGTCIVNGGEIHSDMGGGRAISLNNTGGGGKLYVTGGLISAAGAGRAIQLDNVNSSAWISGSPTITGGLEAIMVQRNGVVVITGTPTLTGVIGTNVASAKLYDARGLSAIVAAPGAGSYVVSQNVSVTGGSGTINKYSGASTVTAGVYSGAGVTPTTVTSTLVYTTDGTTPVVASAPYSTPLTVAVPSTLNVAPLIEGTTIGVVSTLAFSLTGQPFTAAPKPAVYDPTKVISIFSDSYTSGVTGVNFNPGWGQKAVYSTLPIMVNNTIKYTNLDYMGITLTDVNAAAMTYLHVDVWTGDETSVQITPISPATPNSEHLINLTPLVQNSWNSFDIPLASFIGVNMGDVFQFKVVGSNTGKTVYLDNLYFYNTLTTVDITPPSSFTATLGAVTPSSVALVLNGTDDSGALNYAITYGGTVINTGGSSGTAKTYVVTGLTGGTNYSFSIAATDPTGNAYANNPIVVAATTLAPLAVPTISAPTPIVDPSKVLSVYSNAFTNLAPAILYNPYWNQKNLVSTFMVGTNATMKYDNFDYQGIDFQVAIDMTTMTKLHVDVFTPNETTMTIQPIGPTTATTGPAIALTSLALATWNSYDIPLSSFVGLDKTGVHQLMFNGGSGGKVVYVDNIYFYNDIVNSVANVGSTSIKCYPSNVLNTLKVSADTEISSVFVRNLLGQSVKTFVVNSTEKSIDLSAISAGNYLVSLKLANGQSATQKIVKL